MGSQKPMPGSKKRNQLRALGSRRTKCMVGFHHYVGRNKVSQKIAARQARRAAVRPDDLDA